MYYIQKAQKIFLIVKKTIRNILLKMITKLWRHI